MDISTGNTGVTTCFRHEKRESLIRCTRCERYICTDCMREAPVGYQCPECVREGHRSIRQARTRFGGRVVAAPTVTYVLMAVNVLAYAVELARPGIVDLLDGLGTGLIGPDGQRYLDDGGPHPGYDAIGVAHGEWYRLVTSGFLHLLPTAGYFGLAHVVLNMYWLWTLGRVVEEQLGRVRFVALYGLSLLGGSVAEYLIAPSTAAVGASGAIFGLAAGYWMLSRRLHHDPLGGSRLMVAFLLWMVIAARITSWEGHLGGLLAGGAVGLAFAYAPQGQRRTAIQTAGGGLVLLVLAGLVVVKTGQLTGAA